MASKQPDENAVSAGSSDSANAGQADPVRSPVANAAKPDAGAGEIDDEVVVDDGDSPSPGELSLEQTLSKRIEELEAEKKDSFDRLLRAKADLENFRKRSRREQDDARFEAKSRVLKEILPVVDNLERAMVHAESAAAGEAAADAGADAVRGILEGVKLVMRQFEQALEKCDVRVVDAKGKPFDPNVHETMGQMPTDEFEPGAVAQVLQSGYTMGERLLRPAMVVVAMRPPEASAGPNGKSATADADSASADSNDAGSGAAPSEDAGPGGDDSQASADADASNDKDE